MRLPLLALLVSPVFAAIDPAGLVLNVSQDQAQITKVNAKYSDGRKDKTTKRYRQLNIETRYLGSGPAEKATLQWYFIAKSNVDGSFEYYSQGSHDIMVPRASALKVRVLSEALHQDKYLDRDTFPSIAVTAGSLPHGWVLQMLQGSRLIKATASDPGLLEWIKRNPPPEPK